MYLNIIFLIERENMHYIFRAPLFLLQIFSSLRAENKTHGVVLISIDAKEDPRLGFTFLVISSPLSALQDPARNRAFVVVESSTHFLIQVRISLSPCLLMGFCLKTDPFLFHSQISHLFFFFFFFFLFSSPIGKTPHFFCSLFVVATIFDLQSKHTHPTFSKSLPDQPFWTV